MSEQDNTQLEPYNPSDARPVYSGVIDEQTSHELAKGGGVVKVLHLISRSPGAPILWVCVVIVVMVFAKILTTYYFTWLVVIGAWGAWCQRANRKVGTHGSKQ
tara:strand:- start:630 stop:938 length:309 start_codon:yes stop_codon:yes gene_type:complete